MKLRTRLLSAVPPSASAPSRCRPPPTTSSSTRPRQRVRRADLRQGVADQVGTGVLFNVALDPEFNFVTTGDHFVFSFSGTGVAAGRHRHDHRRRRAARSASALQLRSTRRSTRSSSASPARPTAATATRSAATTMPLSVHSRRTRRSPTSSVPSTDAGSLGPAYFAADASAAGTRLRRHRTLIGVTHVTTPVPEPETYALFLAGLGAMGFMAKRRRKTRSEFAATASSDPRRCLRRRCSGRAEASGRCRARGRSAAIAAAAASRSDAVAAVPAQGRERRRRRRRSCAASTRGRSGRSGRRAGRARPRRCAPARAASCQASTTALPRRARSASRRAQNASMSATKKS